MKTYPCKRCKESGYCTRMCRQWCAWFASKWGPMHKDAERLIRNKKAKEGTK